MTTLYIPETPFCTAPPFAATPGLPLRNATETFISQADNTDVASHSNDIASAYELDIDASAGLARTASKLLVSRSIRGQRGEARFANRTVEEQLGMQADPEIAMHKPGHTPPLLCRTHQDGIRLTIVAEMDPLYSNPAERPRLLDALDAANEYSMGVISGRRKQEQVRLQEEVISDVRKLHVRLGPLFLVDVPNPSYIPKGAQSEILQSEQSLPYELESERVMSLTNSLGALTQAADMGSRRNMLADYCEYKLTDMAKPLSQRVYDKYYARMINIASFFLGPRL
jgi:hypothetical protein